MIAALLIVVSLLAIVMWNYFVENPPLPDINIPPSLNKVYNLDKVNAIAPGDIISEIKNHHDKPTLLYIYTTWCSACKKQLPVINEIARKFQNTDLKVIAVAIDRNIDESSLVGYLHNYGNIYFEPSYLLYHDGLGDLLKQRGIEFNKVIPLTVLIKNDGSVDTSFTGYKSEDFLNRRIIKVLANIVQ